MTCGRTSSPPLAIAPIARAIWIGVAAIAPWPMPTEIVSPANHFCLKLRIFHSSDGITPLTSLRQIDARLLSQSERGRIFRNLSMPSFSASV